MGLLLLGNVVILVAPIILYEIFTIGELSQIIWLLLPVAKIAWAVGFTVINPVTGDEVPLQLPPTASTPNE